MILHVSPGHHGATVLSIPRDSMVPTLACPADGPGVPGQQAEPGVNERINETFSNGGPSCLWKTIEHETGIHIDHFIELAFTGFVHIINDIGGVNICLPVAINDPDSGLRPDRGHASRHGTPGARVLAGAPHRHRLRPAAHPAGSVPDGLAPAGDQAQRHPRQPGQDLLGRGRRRQRDDHGHGAQPVHDGEDRRQPQGPVDRLGAVRPGARDPLPGRPRGRGHVRAAAGRPAVQRDRPRHDPAQSGQANQAIKRRAPSASATPSPSATPSATPSPSSPVSGLTKTYGGINGTANACHDQAAFVGGDQPDNFPNPL